MSFEEAAGRLNAEDIILSSGYPDDYGGRKNNKRKCAKAQPLDQHENACSREYENQRETTTCLYRRGEIMSGLFITFEGPEGAGKTTVLQEIKNILTAEGLRLWQLESQAE